MRGTSLEVGAYIREGNSVGAIFDTAVLEVPVSIPVEDARWAFRRLRGLRFPRSQDEVQQFLPSAKIVWNRFGETYEWEGRITLVGAGLDETTRAFTLVAEVADPFRKWVAGKHPPLTVGMFVKVEIRGVTLPSVYVIPRSALHPGDRIFILRDGALDMRSVKVIRKGQDEAVFKSATRFGAAVFASYPGSVLRGLVGGRRTDSAWLGVRLRNEFSWRNRGQQHRHEDGGPGELPE